MAGFNEFIHRILPPLPDKLNFNESPGEEYSDQALLGLARYNGKGDITDDQAARIFQHYLNGSIDKKLIAQVVLHLALSLENPDRKENKELLFAIEGGNTKFPSLVQEIIQSSELGVDLVEGKNDTLNSMFFNLGSTSNPPTVELPSSNVSQEYIISAKFCAAFCLRSMVKITSSVLNAWTNLANRFKVFYGMKMDDAFAKVPESRVLEDLKEKLNADPLIAPTWVRSFNLIEQNANQKSNAFKVVRYLCILPLSYSGMHAFKLFHTARNQLNCDAYWLLTEMYCPETDAAIRDIHKILFNFFPVMGGSKKTQLYKYARLVDSGFFQSLQTKNCIKTIYLLAKIIKNNGISPEGSDPMQIIGLNMISGSTKEFLDQFAQNIQDEIPKQSADIYSSSARRAVESTKKQPSGSGGVFFKI